MAVYWAQMCIEGAEGPVKIGYSANPRERVTGLEYNSPYPLRLLGASNETEPETAIHAKFQEFRLRGEWYRPVEPILRSVPSQERTDFCLMYTNAICRNRDKFREDEVTARFPSDRDARQELAQSAFKVSGEDWETFWAEIFRRRLDTMGGVVPLGRTDDAALMLARKLGCSGKEADRLWVRQSLERFLASGCIELWETETGLQLWFRNAVGYESRIGSTLNQELQLVTLPKNWNTLTAQCVRS